MTSATWLSLKKEISATDYWDMTLIRDLLDSLPEGSDRKVFVIPGAYQADVITEINDELNKHAKVLVIVTSDEENAFPIDKVSHPDMILYMTYPTPGQHVTVDRYLPIGYTPDTRPMLKALGPLNKTASWFFSGQVTHKSRKELAVQLKKADTKGKVVATSGFAQGLTHKQYFRQMARAKVVPAPGGPHSPDSFRLYEALEAGAIPVPEDRKFFELLFDSTPFPVVKDWTSIGDYINNFKDRYPELNNKVFAWWQGEKRRMRHNLFDDLKLSHGNITCLIPTSPIPSHPDTRIIDETIASVRHHLPDAEIIIMVDGVRQEQEKRRKAYNEYVRRLLWKCNFEWGNCYPLLFEEHTHQVGMTREALKHVRTPLILYIEQDCPLVTDESIDVDGISMVILNGHADMVRLHFESSIPEPHKYMMLGETEIEGVPLLRTSQYSQRPHFASADWYRRILDQHFTANAKAFIEDKMHSVAYEAYKIRGKAGWNEYRLMIYNPPGNMRRSKHSDGRQGTEKWDSLQVF